MDQKDISKTIVYKPQGFQPSAHESKFIIEGTLGQGGMGTIYDAFDRNIRRKVAIKSINSDVSQNVITRKYFTKEAQITGQLEHPNIIPVYEMGVNPQDRLYYVMKRVQGMTLADVLDGIKDGQRRMIRQYSLPVLLSIYQKVLDAIAYAHARGVVHLDLKPENIMVGEFGEVLVLDWGIARLRRRSLNVDQSRFVTLDDSVNIGAEHENEQVIGTPAFMAPEQASGRSANIGTRTDIYALGAILYNILTLRAPAAGKTTTVVLKKIVTGRVIDPMSYNEPNNKKEDIINLRHLPDEKIPETLSKVCMKAMEERLEDRYQLVRDLQDDLYAYFSGYATTAEAAGPWRRFYLYVSRNRYLIITICLLLLINLIVLLITLIS
ncbi:MAG: serine/threonine protein kinase [Lentisphaerales bacterium]|nr:serine/threonine protein kinase [Lentisphaerales bacterium]